MNKDITIIGVPTGAGAQDQGCKDGPMYLLDDIIIQKLKTQNINARSITIRNDDLGSNTKTIANVCRALSEETSHLVNKGEQFVIFGGDHSIAIGTWSGVSLAKRDERAIGLLWIDAHLDAHTHDSSISKAIHGMPVAALLGRGNSHLTTIGHKGPKINPDKICYIGVRSFESSEEILIKNLGIKNFSAEYIQAHGLAHAFDDAMTAIQSNTAGFGISLDLDAIDPKQAPGVGSPEPNGIDAIELLQCMRALSSNPNFLGIEITEFNPYRDQVGKTKQFVHDLVCAIFSNNGQT